MQVEAPPSDQNEHGVTVPPDSISAGTRANVPALRESRHHRIVALLNERGEVTVSEMASFFGVSDMTIRRDLRELQRHGQLQRKHGGAVPSMEPTTTLEPPLEQRFGAQTAQKRRIARAVASMLNDGETVFLGSGTTVGIVAEVLATDRHLTVITNAVTVINRLAAAPQIELVVTGGFLRREEMSLIGHFVEESVQDIRVDKVIIGVRGLDADHGLTSDYLPELKTDRAILQAGGEVIVAADSTKFGHVGLSRMAPVTAASTIVTDEEAPPRIVSRLRDTGMRIVIV